MASLRLAVRAVIGPIGIRISYKTIADVDANGNANANANANANVNANAIAIEGKSKIGRRFEILKDSHPSSYMAGEWPRIVTR